MLSLILLIQNYQKNVIENTYHQKNVIETTYQQITINQRPSKSKV